MKTGLDKAEIKDIFDSADSSVRARTDPVLAHAWRPADQPRGVHRAHGIDWDVHSLRGPMTDGSNSEASNLQGVWPQKGCVCAWCERRVKKTLATVASVTMANVYVFAVVHGRYRRPAFQGPCSVCGEMRCVF
eukprot:2570812-Prymnesium_polylepis.2